MAEGSRRQGGLIGLTVGAALIPERKRRKIFQFCFDTTDLGRFGFGSG